jgi:hypothetical protein
MGKIGIKCDSGLFDAHSRFRAISSMCGKHMAYKVLAYKVSRTPTEILLSFPNSLCAAASKVTVQVAMTCSRRLCIPKSKEIPWMLELSAFVQEQDEQLNCSERRGGTRSSTKVTSSQIHVQRAANERARITRNALLLLACLTINKTQRASMFAALFAVA